jgi:hypothetical protein
VRDVGEVELLRVGVGHAAEVLFVRALPLGPGEPRRGEGGGVGGEEGEERGAEEVHHGLADHGLDGQDLARAQGRQEDLFEV